MTLVMRTAKGAVSFEWNDEDAETVVKIEPTDTDEVMVRKLKRIIALAEGGQAPPPAELLERYQSKVTELTGFPSGPPTNGWAAYAPPKVPEHLEGEVELVQPGEGV